MDSDSVLDYAFFQLSPRRTRCELFVSGDGKTEKLASGFLKPFLTHLKVAEEQAAQLVKSIRLEVGGRKNVGTWFNKGTLERFVRFVSTPEVLELVNTFDVEMSQLEGARKIYSQGAGDQLSEAFGENETSAASSADITKKELLRAIDVRLVAVKQDLATALFRASAAGFTLDTVSELLLFADRFGAIRLNDACTKFISLCQRRPELIGHQHVLSPAVPPQWKSFDDANLRSSSGSDMSIDEGDVEPTGNFKLSTSGGSGAGPELHKPSSGQLPQQPIAQLETTRQQSKPIIQNLVDDASKAKEESTPAVPLAEPAQSAVGGGSRRLSVQDRINLFENKQKEQSTSSSISSSSTGGGGINRAVVGKPEHRRLPSDVSVEKSVLRRWSGASDMSIDLNNNSISSDRRESESAAGTPTSYSQAQSGDKAEGKEAGGLKDMATSRSLSGLKDNPAVVSPSLSSSQAQGRALPKDRDQSEDILLREGATIASKAQPVPSLEEEGNSKIQHNTSLGRGQQDMLNDQVVYQIRSKAVSESDEGAGLKDRPAFLTQFKAVPEQHTGRKDQEALQTPSREVAALTVPAEQKDLGNLWMQPGNQAAADDIGAKNQATTVTKFRTFASKKEDVGVKSKGPLDLQTTFKASSGKEEVVAQKNDVLPFQTQKTFPEKQVDTVRKEAAASEVPFKAFSFKVEEDSGTQGMKLQGRAAAPDQIQKLQRKDDGEPNQGTAKLVFPGKKVNEDARLLDLPSTPLMEQVQVVRPSKGNYELNDELQMKANELEKLFAAHKLRVQGDQLASSRRSKPVDDQVPKTVEKRREALPGPFQEGTLPGESSSDRIEFDANSLLKIVDNWDYSDSIKQKIGSLGSSDDSRGLLYEKYMQKRDAKLREEWGLKRTQKEARMKAMHDSLELSQAEMKAKLTGSGGKDLAHARHRVEKMRSFSALSAIKNKEQTLEHVQGEGTRDVQELSEQVHFVQDISYGDALSGNESSTSIHSNKLLHTKSLSSSTPRTSINPIPRPSVKVTNSGSIRRRAQPENPLAQSVPNFSDIRKENTKPSSGLSKVTPRAQSRTFARSKSTTEETNLVKEEKPRRSHSMRKSSASPGELKDLSPLSSDGANLTPLKVSKEQIEQAVNKFQKIAEPKPFLRKGNGIGPGAGVGIAKLKASMTTEVLKNEVEFEGLVDQQEDSSDIVKDDAQDFDGTSAREHLQATDFPVDSDNEEPRMSQESGDSANAGSENGNVLGSHTQADDDIAAPCSMLNAAAGNVQESPGESPGSWNSHIHHSFSYAHEASDIDAFVDSPTGSPASWSSHPLNQMMEADAARMRKNWGNAQIPVLVANAPHSRKDVTKGFKRLLKFGRKSRGAELITDWVSASTTSEGDDDTEDGRDLATRPSDDLRKSRMGYSISSYDGFNEGDIFHDQVQSLRTSIPNPPANFKLREDHLSGSSLKAPRSFFSLSSFRSKGSESKPR